MLIFLLVGIVLGMTPECPVPRDTLIQCFRKLLDKNRDSIITVAEIDNYLATQTCIPRTVSDHLSGTILMNTCDLNRDGALTLADWTPSNACVTNPKRIEMICHLCVKCGWDEMK